MMSGVLTSNRTTYFPRYGFCQFEQNIYVGQGNLREVQCALIVNAYNEKAYLVVYFWLLFLLMVTFINALYTTLYYIMPFTRVVYAKKLLKVHRASFSDS
jgi:hypothetical protein